MQCLGNTVCLENTVIPMGNALLPKKYCNFFEKIKYIGNTVMPKIYCNSYKIPQHPEIIVNLMPKKYYNI